ncbi:MAG TPA: secretin N-terminal domain-containing protein [Planctomycetota bacterium]|nr:secretin N-terminal domain-containing protein [Planctomycetota bacterium]
MSRLLPSWVLASAFILAQQPAAPPGRLSVKHQGDALTLSADGPAVTLQELALRWSETTGRNFTYSPRIAFEPVLQLTGAVQAKASDADFLFESLLVRAGFALVAVGPVESKLFGVEAIEQGRSFKQTATFVPPERVPELARRPAQVFTTSFVLRHAASQAVRAAVSQLLTNRAIELTSEVVTTNTLMFTGLGPTLVAVKELVESLDVQAPPRRQAFETFALKYAPAAELAAALDVLLARRSGPQAQRPDMQGFETPEPLPTRIVPDARTNALIVSGSPEMLETVRFLVAQLDVDAKK